MPLKLGLLGEQIAEMVQASVAEDRGRWLEQARQLLRSLDPDELRAKLEERVVRLPWLVAVPVGGVHGVHEAGRCPSSFSVVAADGSNISPDRHNPLRFYVLNTGYAVLTYGDQPAAILDSAPRFYFREEDLYMDPLVRSAPVEGARLSAKMCLAEMRTLVEVTEQVEELPVVALRDGSLITWGLQTEDPAFVQERFLTEFLTYLDRFRALRIPLVSYISYPGARDVVNSLRVWLCPREDVDCTSCPSSGVEEFCKALREIRDRELFGFLEDGQRSDVFDSKSAILDRYGRHRIRFFYMDVGGEVVRLEAPEWVTDDAQMLDVIQALVLDQCRRSAIHPPYPPALQEAHEQALISGADRRVVQRLMERSLAQQGIVHGGSAKSGSKRKRGV
jgi:hypothetical protein